jgi:hypothetical protein
MHRTALLQALPEDWALPQPGASPDKTTLRPLRLRGRYMLADRTEYGCETLAVEVDGIELQAESGGKIGERVIAYIDELGRVEGRIVAFEPGRLRITPTITAAKHERFLRKITWLHEREAGRASELRRHERIEPETKTQFEILLSDGRFAAQVIDYSQSGVALQTTAPLKIGDTLNFNGAKARIVRSGPGFLAAQFDAA